MVVMSTIAANVEDEHESSLQELESGILSESGEFMEKGRRIYNLPARAKLLKKKRLEKEKQREEEKKKAEQRN
ncbi:unnamed protein product [Orchesella dallaii]|uniref:Uncharacterized protein n=1 Tax=Orchesella dallaii TaxID=48710 RepID=A0ABP1PYL1_9HEXA